MSAVALETRLLCRVIQDRDLTPLRLLGIDASWFHENDDKRLFQFLVDHYAKHGEVPTGKIVKLNFPTYKLWRVEDSLEPLVELMRDKRAYGVLVGAVQDAGEALEEDRDWRAASQALRAGLTEVDIETAALVDLDLGSDRSAEDFLVAYHYLAEHPADLLGLPTGFPTIDKATLGLQPEQLVCIIATPKVGKSTLSLKIARNIVAAHPDKRGLFCSFEMSAREQENRYRAMVAEVPHHRLLTGKLDHDEVKRLERRTRASIGEQLILSVDISAATTIGGIAAKIETHKPDYVVIDGVYLMQDEQGEKPGSPQALTNITRGMKRLAQRFKIPIIISTQVLPSKMNKRDGVTADAIGYSSSFFQDSDVILGLDKGEDDDTRLLKVVESRNCGKVGVTLLWDWVSSRFEEVAGSYVEGPENDAGDESEDYEVA